MATPLGPGWVAQGRFIAQFGDKRGDQGLVFKISGIEGPEALRHFSPRQASALRAHDTHGLIAESLRGGRDGREVRLTWNARGAMPGEWIVERAGGR